MNYMTPLLPRLRLPRLNLPSTWPLPFPQGRDACRCGHPRYMHEPLLRSDGTREDAGSEKAPIDPCTFVGCTCGYYEAL